MLFLISTELVRPLPVGGDRCGRTANWNQKRESLHLTAAGPPWSQEPQEVVAEQGDGEAPIEQEPAYLTHYGGAIDHALAGAVQSLDVLLLDSLLGNEGNFEDNLQIVTDC
jgi:hypothetical protein